MADKERVGIIGIGRMSSTNRSSHLAATARYSTPLEISSGKTWCLCTNSAESDLRREILARHLGGQRIAQRPVAVEAELEGEALVAQEGAGVDQRVEPLLLEEPGHAQEP